LNITIIAPLDIAHQASLLWKGFNEYTKHGARLITLKQTYLDYPIDILYREDEDTRDRILDVFAKTDFYIFFSQITVFPFFSWAGVLNRNNHLVMTFGTDARVMAPQFLFSWLRNDTMIVSSHDYSQSSLLGFSAQHIPISIDFSEIPERQPPGDDVIRIVHTPTFRPLKGTDMFLKAVERLRKKGLKVEPVLVEGKPWKECLRIKSQCDICYDQYAIGSYGMAAVESWAMRQPVVGRVNSWIRSWYPDIPVIDVTEKTLEKRLQDLVEHPDLREEAGKEGRLFVEQNHDLRMNIRKLEYLVKFTMERG